MMTFSFTNKKIEDWKISKEIEWDWKRLKKTEKYWKVLNGTENRFQWCSTPWKRINFYKNGLICQICWIISSNLLYQTSMFACETIHFWVSFIPHFFNIEIRLQIELEIKWTKWMWMNSINWLWQHLRSDVSISKENVNRFETHSFLFLSHVISFELWHSDRNGHILKSRTIGRC